jgi:hypothetical protein
VDASTAPQCLELNCQCCLLHGVLEAGARSSLSKRLIGLWALYATFVIFVHIRGSTPLHVRFCDLGLEVEFVVWTSLGEEIDLFILIRSGYEEGQEMGCTSILTPLIFLFGQCTPTIWDVVCLLDPHLPLALSNFRFTFTLFDCASAIRILQLHIYGMICPPPHCGVAVNTCSYLLSHAKA